MKRPPPPRYTTAYKLRIVQDVLAYQRLHDCTQRKAITDLGHKFETVSHWILKYHRGELMDRSAEATTNALAWYERGYTIADAAQKAGIPENALVNALKRGAAKPRHFHFS